VGFGQRLIKAVFVLSYRLSNVQFQNLIVFQLLVLSSFSCLSSFSSLSPSSSLQFIKDLDLRSLLQMVSWKTSFQLFIESYSNLNAIDVFQGDVSLIDWRIGWTLVKKASSFVRIIIQHLEEGRLWTWSLLMCLSLSTTFLYSALHF